jgi:hypothetical protein
MTFKLMGRISSLFALALGMMAGTLIGQSAVKLFLKDGTYHLVKTYEVRGDRVRYYSIERSDWEEVPASLVDFEATRRAQQEEKVSQKKAEEEAREIDKQRFEQIANLGYEIAPGTRLPKDEGVFAFDGQRVIRMIQSPAEVITDKKRAALVMAMPAPVLKSRRLAVLPGAKAAVRISALQPAFYVQLQDTSVQKLELITVKSNKESRVVEKIETRFRKPAESRSEVAVERTEIRPGLFKIRPTQPLAPGEYALAELLSEKLNLDVWDFGIDKPLSNVNLAPK